MPLVKCYECFREVSDQAAACPHCGVPMGVRQGRAKVYACPVCGMMSAGRRTVGWYLWLIVGLLLTPIFIGFVILICLPFVNKACPKCHSTLTAEDKQ